MANASEDRVVGNYAMNSTNYSDADYQFGVSNVDSAELDNFVRIVVPVSPE